MNDAKCKAPSRGLSCCRRAGHPGRCATVAIDTPLFQKLSGYADELQELAWRVSAGGHTDTHEATEAEAEDICRGIRAAFRESTF